MYYNFCDLPNRFDVLQFVTVYQTAYQASIIGYLKLQETPH